MTLSEAEAKLPNPNNYSQWDKVDIYLYDYYTAILPYPPNKICYTFQARNIGNTNKLYWSCLGINFDKSEFNKYE